MNVLCFLIFVNLLLSLNGDLAKFSNCTSRLTCADCIKTSGCGWCSNGDFHGEDKLPLARCNSTEGHELLGRFKCPQRFLFNPHTVVNNTKNEGISEQNSGSGRNSNPISPQEIVLTLRIGEPADINLFYKDRKDHPLDLYYLMDLTSTMRDDKEVLAKLGDALGESIKDITKEFRQGFGSFIDKVTMPYIMTTPGKFENPCGSKDSCVKPYGFKNHLKISNAVDKFSQTVTNAALSASVDLPEGGLDALMQVMVCEQIGWSREARKLIIFATDAPFHTAGDGKLGGILHRNDGKCHLNAEGEYTHSTEMDYPSIAQLNQQAIEKSVSIIFAVTVNETDIYSKLATRIEGAQSAELSRNSSNIVDLVANEYRRITSKVEMKDNLPKKYVRVRYFSKCVKKDGNKTETNSCDELPIGSTVQFSLKIELIECPANKKEWAQIYKIYRVGLPEGITVHLKMLCGCTCENEENWIINSKNCGGFGTEKCGLCDCDENHFGRVCECSANNGAIPVDEMKACKAENSTEVCSGRGDCNCAKCECHKRENPDEKFSGQYCECDNFSCEQFNGEVCAGHGACECGSCRCSPGWGGSACECSSDSSKCTEPGSNEECSGMGVCTCGKCVCNGKYSGPYCEKCRSCPTRCRELSLCVQCKVHGTGQYENPSDCELNCFQHTINTVDIIQYDSTSDDVKCIGDDVTDECAFHFVYQVQKNKGVLINAQKTKECPPTPPIFWILIAIISVIVIGGLCLLITWKVYTTVLDKREYANFENELKSGHTNTENPLYQTPVGVYQNPAYGKRPQ